VKALKLILVPLLAAVAVTAALYALGGGRHATAPAQEPLVQVVVMAKAITARTALQAGDLAMTQVPKTLLGHGEFTRIDAVIGMLTTQPLSVGQIVLGTQVTDAAKGALAYRVPAGFRAMTLRVDEYSGNGGFPDPGDRVDVILAVPKDLTNKVPGFARVLVQDREVLARGPHEEAVKGGAGPVGGGKLTSYTLSVTPDEAAMLALAQQAGLLTLVLRPVPAPGIVPAPIIPDSRLSQ
jgi:pilus assembly protein CpaB